MMRAGRRGWSRQLGLAVALMGSVLGIAGVVLSLAEANGAVAAGLAVCGNSLRMAPGSSGSCSETVRDTGNSSNTQVNVSLSIRTASASGGGTAGSGLASEALLDGRPDGLQVTVTDSTTGTNFPLGSVSCYTGPSRSASASYPNAAYCASSSSPRTLASKVSNRSFRNTFVIKWSFPLAAGNQYQGAGATVQLQSTYTGTTGGGVLGSSTTQPGPQGGVLGASTPGAGAGLPGALSLLTILLGSLLVVSGLVAYRRSRPVPEPIPSDRI